MKKPGLLHLISLLIVAVLIGHVVGLIPIAFIDTVDRSIYDGRLRLTMPGTVDQRLAIVDIDEKSLAEVGRWPWPRDRMASLVDKLFDHYHVRLLGLDIVMAERDDSSGLRSLEALGKRQLQNDPAFQRVLTQLRPELDFDNLFAESLHNRSVILGYYLSNGATTAGALPPPAMDARLMEGKEVAATHWRSYGGNLAAFQKAAAGAGHFNPIIDPDGSVRRVPLLALHEGNYYDSFSLALARAYLNGATVTPHFGGALLESLHLVNGRRFLRDIPVDENVAAWVPYRGPERSFRYFSAADILAGRIPQQELAGKIIILGTSAPGLRDLRNTPVGEVLPGMEVHANLVTGILDNTIKQRPAYMNAAEVTLMAILGCGMIFFFPWRSPLRSSAAVVITASVLVGFNLALWQLGNLIMPLAASLVMVLALYGWHTGYGYFNESRAKLLITQRFGQYVPPELVARMLLDPSRYSMDSRRADLTVLFSDVRGFTSIAEGLSPEDLADLMNAYLTAMTEIIRRHGGTLDKYIGDAIVAFWGAPIDDPEHARHAVMAALEMQAELRTLNKKFRDKNWPALQVGIGINTGPMTVGDMGSRIRLAYTVIGDAVNLGARLEGLTKDYGVDILVGETTRERTQDMVYRELDRVQVKGKEQVVTIFQPLGSQSDAAVLALAQLSDWNAMLQHYRAARWDIAESLLRKLLLIDPQCLLYQTTMRRIETFRLSEPHAGWNGVTRFHTK
ncbi:MAG: adenylate/guanylate cyclase with Chase sensor [Herminiimonas sp.]|nr:adenylate/guanylate cyclase with Chase sensor [Herminiimonas sp.]